MEIATKVEQQLLKFPDDLDAKTKKPEKSPDDLRKLFRIVS